MNKRKIIIIFATILLVIVGIMYFFPNEKMDKTDAIKFAEEYNEVSKENTFKYKTNSEIVSILKNGTGIVYLGFPECKWCQRYVSYLSEVANGIGIDIYYLNIYEDRQNETEEYKEMVDLLKDYLQKDNLGNPRIFVPNITMLIDGKIVFNDYETSLDLDGSETPDEYWNFVRVNALKDRLEENMIKVKNSMKICSSCNE